MLLEQLPNELSRGFRVTPALDEEVQNFAFIVHDAPKPIALPPDDDHRFVEVPVVARPGAGKA